MLIKIVPIKALYSTAIVFTLLTYECSGVLIRDQNRVRFPSTVFGDWPPELGMINCFFAISFLMSFLNPPTLASIL